MPDSPFSKEHRLGFLELLAAGELSALNGSDEHSDFGPWHLCRATGDSDSGRRLIDRFRAAVHTAALACGAPYRVNRLDWWVSKLVKGASLLSIDLLIKRSAEYCEQLEARSREIGAPQKPSGARVLYRDRYPCGWGEPYMLYDGPPRQFPEPTAEFEYWTEHIWSGFNDDIAKLSQMHLPQKRRENEARQAYWVRVKHRIGFRYTILKKTLRGLSYDLAVLHANHIIDQGFQGDDAVGAFQSESPIIIQTIERFWRESSKLLGLSRRKQENVVDAVAGILREVETDMSGITSQIVSPSKPGLPNSATGQQGEAYGETPRYALNAIHEDLERRADAKRHLEQALKFYADSLDKRSDLSLIELARLWGAYSTRLYDSLAESCSGQTDDPTALFGESGELFGGSTVARVKYDLKTLWIPPPQHWPPPNDFGPGTDLEQHQIFQSITRHTPVTFSVFLDDPWFMSEIIRLVDDRVRHWRVRLGGPPSLKAQKGVIRGRARA
jgi:hypothetical protein